MCTLAERMIVHGPKREGGHINRRRRRRTERTDFPELIFGQGGNREVQRKNREQLGAKGIKDELRVEESTPHFSSISFPFLNL